MTPTALAGALLLSLLAGCSGGGSGGGTDLDPAPGGDFEITLGGVGTLVEGDDNGLFVPITLTRSNGHQRAVTLSVAGADASDGRNLVASFEDPTLEGDERDSGVRLSLGIDAQPIAAGTRRLWFTASDGLVEDRVGVDIQVDPTSAPDVYLLAGQSNMVGFSGEATRQAEPGGPDASHPRILQLNVSGNDPDATFVTASDFTSQSKNVRDPRLVVAEDPLHQPRGTPDAISGNGKEEQYIGLGLSFAKRALLETTAEIVLVPAAWSGSSFCANANGPQGNWNPRSGADDDPALGNDLLLERAILRTDLALQASGGVLRGILWHQGEADSNETCAPLYAQNLDTLARVLRSRIAADARGASARGADADIPFVVGTLSRGRDEREDLSVFSAAKQTVDDAIRGTAERLNYAAVSNHDDLVPDNGYPCGNGSCIHFGAAALREMGRRYHDALQRALLDRAQ